MAVQYWTFKQLRCADWKELRDQHKSAFFQFMQYLVRKSRPGYNRPKWKAFYDALEKCEFAMFATPDVQTGVAQVAMNNMVDGDSHHAVMHFSSAGCGLHVYGHNDKNLTCLFNKPARNCGLHYSDISTITEGPDQLQIQIENACAILQTFMPILKNYGISKITVLVTGILTHGTNDICQRFVDLVFAKTDIAPKLQMHTEQEMVHLQALRTCYLVFQNLSASDCEH